MALKPSLESQAMATRFFYIETENVKGVPVLFRVRFSHLVGEDGGYVGVATDTRKGVFDSTARIVRVEIPGPEDCEVSALACFAALREETLAKIP